ncbi:WD40-repeat-containing domain protein [Dunaliella salina]|uniref:WD40-repeat-containing domain protein n=1 Tax=Dunaliella salina TaxID=3046 RepID=A0ABQ7H3G4_DUNSA|nr:WD40-repeat-containing domain protein [Dunaliella salina]|eukprot:KAF5841409.1 WD40-repeat-containing domain protein [Dunaliella salina]
MVFEPTCLHHLKGEEHFKQASVPCVLFAQPPDGDLLLLTVSENGGIKLWDVASGKAIQDLGDGHTAATTKDGRIAATCFKNEVKIWNLSTRENKVMCTDHEGVGSIAFSPDGATLATGSFDGTIRLWDVATGNHKATLMTKEMVCGVAFSPDGMLLSHAAYFSPSKPSASVWDWRTNTRLSVLEGHRSDVWTTIWSLDGEHVLTAGNDRAIGVWEVSNPSSPTLKHWLKDWDAVKCLAVTPDGDHLVSGSYDDKIR